MAFDKIVPEWGAAGTEPPSALKQNGWQAGQKPPAEYFNWFFNGMSKAVSELQSKAITSDDHKIKSYTSLGSIGIGIGGETVQSIFNSLSAGSEISYYVNASNRQSVYPDYGDTNKIGLCRCYKVNSSFMEMTFFRTGNSGGVVQRWYAYYSATNGFSGWKEIAFSTNGTVTSSNADYAEVGQWADGNTADEDRIGYFVAVDPSTAGTTMVKATSAMDVRGVTVSAPAFSGNCSADKFDAETGALLKQYDFVAVMGLVSVIDNGTCTINGRCMPNDNGTAVPSSNNLGYQVIDRIDSTHILIAVEPGADMLKRIKDDVVTLQNHASSKSNPHGVTKAQVGLGNVDNTSDANKPVSTAQAKAIADAKKAGTDAQTNLNSHEANKSNPHGVTAAQAGAYSKGETDTLLANKIDASAGAGAHNAIYRGKYLGDSVTAEQYAAIQAGTFDGLYIGDYWTISGINYRIAAFDYYLKTGDNACNTHHVTVVPDNKLYDHVMNDTNVTTGGYVGSKMYTTGLADAKATINNAFGSAHILTRRELFTNAVSNGKPSGGSWYDSTVDLMTEQNVYGSRFFAPAPDGTTIPYQYVVDKSQYPLFAFRPDLISNRTWYWLRDVVSAAIFAYVSHYGGAAYGNASDARGVRPAFSIKA